jgi:hypothetical protein
MSDTSTSTHAAHAHHGPDPREAFRAITRDVANVAEMPKPPKVWLIALGIAMLVAWAWDITNFVFWIGIGHAGTLISAILFLTRQKWRTSINRAAEAMTIFAVMCAGIFPILHTGRPWFAWWLFPHPNDMPDVAAVPQPADVGRVRDLDLRDGLDPVLVHGPGPRPRHAPRPREDQGCARSSTASCRSAGAARRGSGTATSART